jgi:hypothetical protein
MTGLLRIVCGDTTITTPSKDWSSSCVPTGIHREDIDIRFQLVKIQKILESMITVEPTFAFQLGPVHTALFPNHNSRPKHTAKKDTLALEDIIREILQQANRLEAESNAHT